MSKRTPERDPAEPRKRAYRPPKLVRYGTIVELTQAQLFKSGQPDGLFGMTKFLKFFFKSS